MDLKLKAAPEMKNNPNQKLYSLNTFTSSNTTDNIFPVIMHFDIAVPSKYIDIISEGTILYFYPYNTPNCSM